MSGVLYIVGGGINQSEEQIFSEFIKSSGGPLAKFAFVVSASGDNPDAVFESYVETFAKLGVARQRCVLIPLYAQHVKDKHGFNARNGDHDCIPPAFENVTGVWFSGGDQYHTAKCLLRSDGTYTRALKIIHQIYKQGGSIGGSSAGAAIMGRIMIGGGNNRGVLYHDTVFGYDDYKEISQKDDSVSPLILAKGLGFFPCGIIDQHFNKRPRLLRLIEACITNPQGVDQGFGISEDTALVYKDNVIEVLGTGSVYIIDCCNAVKTANGCYDGLMLHALQQGDRLNQKTGKFMLADDCKNKNTKYVTRDYISGGIIDSPFFSDFIDTNLLSAKGNCIYSSGEKCIYSAKESVIYEAHEKTYKVVLKYFRDENTKGYRSVRSTSFVNVCLTVSTYLGNL